MSGSARRKHHQPGDHVSRLARSAALPGPLRWCRGALSLRVVTMLAVISLLLNVLASHPGGGLSMLSAAGTTSSAVVASPEVMAALQAAGFICAADGHDGGTPASDALPHDKQAPCQACLDCCLNLPPFLLSQTVVLIRHNAGVAATLAAFYRLFLGFTARLRPDVRGPPLLLSS
ncbi:hypothetical protein SAMN05421779_105194 [Insolitispirillum peregrinum]|uniref:DUF2946 domain-containing protein n=2 Tax=Insolitispirillum peregrinum TaxID=80876 RepID=A0A1N7NKU6_9PROT|nr:hypothetical protein SAMN05421779_105194 [Insolitispirillum peregrinum]